MFALVGGGKDDDIEARDDGFKIMLIYPAFQRASHRLQCSAVGGTFSNPCGRDTGRPWFLAPMPDDVTLCLTDGHDTNTEVQGTSDAKRSGRQSEALEILVILRDGED